MRVMMDSILASLPGMSIAFVALFLIMGIYGIIGVNFWAEHFPDYFGNFLKAVLSLLQIMTFDSWSSGIARPVILSEWGGAVAAIYFITYVFIASIIMANVLIALLLDEFMNTSNDSRSEEAAEEEDGDEKDELNNVLDEKHHQMAEQFLGDNRHSGLVAQSGKLMALLDGSRQGNIVQDGSQRTPSDQRAGGAVPGGGAVEMGQYPKKASNRANSGGGYGDEEVDNPHDPTWRRKVDDNIRILARSLDKLHQKFDQIIVPPSHTTPDYLT